MHYLRISNTITDLRLLIEGNYYLLVSTININFT